MARRVGFRGLFRHGFGLGLGVGEVLGILVLGHRSELLLDCCELGVLGGERFAVGLDLGLLLCLWNRVTRGG